MKDEPKKPLHACVVPSSARERVAADLRRDYPGHSVRTCIRHIRAFNASYPIAVVAIFPIEE